MQNNNTDIKKLKKNMLQIKALLFFMVVLVGFSFSPYIKNVLALLNDYDSVSVGSALTSDMWNNLDDDFLRTDGGNSMNGNKITNVGTPSASDLSSTAATKGYVDSVAGGSLSCTTVIGSSSLDVDSQTRAYCAAGYKITGGGCSPFYGETGGSITGWLHNSAQEYICKCLGRQCNPMARCCKIL